MTTTHRPPSLEAKLVVLGAQGVGKTSLVHRYVKNDFIPPNKVQTTVGASFLTARVHDPESATTIRLQIWDTAGQERFRSISRLYYRGANAAILCYDVTSAKSFEEMGVWLKELMEHCGADSEEDMILHIVGTKSDVVGAEPKKREVPFERCIGYVGELLSPNPPHDAHAGITPTSNRSSGFWAHDSIWDFCHEISAKDGEGIDEVFRVITRKLVEQHAARAAKQHAIEGSRGRTPGIREGAGGGNPGQGYFDLPGGGSGSFRLGHGDKRKSWLSAFPTPVGLPTGGGEEEDVNEVVAKGVGSKRCC